MVSAGRPPPKVSFAFRVDPGDLDKIERIAEAEGRSAGDVMRHLVKGALDPREGVQMVFRRRPNYDPEPDPEEIRDLTPDELQQFVEALRVHLLAIHQDQVTGRLRSKTPAEQAKFDYGLRVHDVAIRRLEEHRMIEDLFRRDGLMLGLAGASDQFRDAVLQGVQAAEKLREEMINNGQSTACANQVYEDNINKLKGVYGTTKAAVAAVDELISKYGNLARMPNIAKTMVSLASMEDVEA